ncbi:MAG: transposase [Polyangiales bacterium]
MAAQQELPFNAKSGWGGARPGAGRPKSGKKPARVPHVARPPVSRHRPHHVTVRVARGTWNLRSQRCFRPISKALEAATERAGFRVVHFSVQHNHVHMIIEANDRRTMSNAMRSLLIRVARGINGVMGVRGRRFEDRYHEHVLRTPNEARNALRYVIRNRAHHLAQWGKRDGGWVDEYSSESRALGSLVRPPRSWLLIDGWTRAGPL